MVCIANAYTPQIVLTRNSRQSNIYMKMCVSIDGNVNVRVADTASVAVVVSLFLFFSVYFAKILY